MTNSNTSEDKHHDGEDAGLQEAPIGSVTVAELMKCRACMIESREMSNIEMRFDEESTITLHDAIKECSKAVIIVNDGMPQHLCQQCVKELRTAYYFKRKLQNSINEYRRKLYTNIKIKTEKSQQESVINEPPIAALKDVKSDPTAQKNERIGLYENDVTIFEDKDDDVLSLHSNSDSDNNSDFSGAEKSGNSIENSNEGSHNRAKNKNRKEKQIYICNKCPDIKFKVRGPWLRHLKLHETVDNVRKCRYCDKTFASRKYCLQHERGYHLNETNYQCELCGKKLFNAGYLNAHMRTHYQQKDNNCRICFKKFENISILKQHILDEHSPFSCEFCGKKFHRKNCWEMHERKHRQERPFQCEQCPKIYDNPDMLKKHRASVHDCIRYDCVYCHKLFTRKQYLVTHIKSYHTDGEIKIASRGEAYPHSCKDCPRRFRNLEEMVGHDCIATLKYECKKCPLRFALETELKAHRSEHIAKVECPNCGKKFKRINFERHLLTHEPNYVPTQMPNPKSKECPLCHRKFSREGNFKKHLESHSESKSQENSGNGEYYKYVDTSS